MPKESEGRRGGRSPGSRSGRREARRGGESGPGAAGGPAAAADRVTSWRGFRLLHFQIQALEAIEAGKSVLVSAPTGAGKTLVAEYAIAAAVARGRRCVYTAPIKALSNQKYRDFRDSIDVGLLTGDVTIRPTAQVLVMTTEILRNSVLEDPAGLSDVDYVIFDEVHYMDDLERGSVWEESLIFAPEATRYIALSATIANLEELGGWLREIRRHELSVIHSTRRPVPLSHRLYAERSGLFDHSRLAWVRKNEQAGTGPRGPRGRRGRGGPGGRGSPGRRGRFGEGGGRPRQRFEGVRLDPLLDRLHDEGNLPALVFSFSRRDCERLARRSRRRSLLAPEEAERMEELSRELARTFQLDERELLGEVFQLASRGVAYHHAGMLPTHKEVVERMFTSGLLKLLFTTETFALGINMPARTVVFSSLRKFDGVSFDYVRTRDYLQMAGRAGRQGIDPEGLVISALDPRDLQEAPLKELLFGKPEPILSRFRLTYSTLLHLLGHLGRTRVYEAWEKSFNQFQHRGKSRKAREENRLLQREIIDAHLGVLRELGYLDDEDRLSPKGRIARILYGYELQLTEMLFEGTLETLSASQIAVIFVALIHEERRNQPPVRVPARLFGGLRHHVDQRLGRLAGVEARHGVPASMKLPRWGLTAAVLAWVEGTGIEEVADSAKRSPGDICRTFRMALQLVRQVRRVLDPEDSLLDRLDEVVYAIDRDEVDARRQLELG